MDPVREEEKRLIYDYLTHQANFPTRSKKDKLCQHVRKDEYVEHAKHVLEKTQSKRFKEFQQLHPEENKTAEIRANEAIFWERACERNRQSCLCGENIVCKILFDSCMKFQNSPERNFK